MILTKKQLISLVFFLPVLLALVVAIYLAKSRQDIRPRALAGKAQMLLFSDKNDANIGESINIAASMQMTDQNVKVSAVDVMILYDKEKLDVVNITPATWENRSDGVFTHSPVVTSGGKYDDTYNFVRLVEISKAKDELLSSSTIPLANITFRALAEGSGVVKFAEDPQRIIIVGK